MDFQTEENVVYGMSSVLDDINGYEGKTPADLIEKNGSRDIFKLIKRGYMFDDEVLKNAHVTKIVREGETYNEIVPRKIEKNKKEYKKDTASYEEIIESLSYVEVEEEQKNDDEETEDLYENEEE